MADNFIGLIEYLIQLKGEKGSDFFYSTKKIFIKCCSIFF